MRLAPVRGGPAVLGRGSAGIAPDGRRRGAAFGLLSVAIFGGEDTVVGPGRQESTGVGIALDDLSDYPTHLTVDGFMVELTNLTATETYQVVVSSDSARVGIGGCGTPGTATAPHKVGRPGVTSGLRRLTVRWDAPSDGGSPIDRYKVQVTTKPAPGSDPSWPADNAAKEVRDATTTTLGSLHNGDRLVNDTTYLVRVRACNAVACGTWSDPKAGTPKAIAPPALPPPENLDVEPLAGRRARLTWDAVTDARKYVIKVKQFGPRYSWGAPDRRNSSSGDVNRPADASPPPTEYEINLDAIVTSATGTPSGLSHAPYAYEFRIMAESDSDSFADSGFSRKIIIIDTPITRANGDSSDTATGKAEFSWTTINSVLGNVYSSGFYQLRYRKAAGDHTAADWDPNDFNSFEEPRNNVSSPATIDGLDLQEIYAVQLTKRNSGPANNIDVFSARDVYVWPSTGQAANGSWIANMPVTAFLNDNTFIYRICTDTFSNETGVRKKDWETLIDHAFGRWQSALTSNFITIVRESDPCANYDLIARRWSEAIAKKIPTLKPGLTDQQKVELIEAFVRRMREENSDIWWRLRLLTSATNADDLKKSEVLMFDDVDGDLEYFIDVGIFPELASDLGVASSCWYYHDTDPPELDIGSGRGVTLMCTHTQDYFAESILGVIPIHPRHSSDIFIRRSLFKNASLAVPMSDDVMNTCGSAGAAYSAFIHEIGHALGIARGNTDGPRAGTNRGHPPEIMDGNTVMIYTNKGNYPRCAPYPLDLMAINSLYQTVD